MATKQELEDASLFLMQSTLGANYTLINSVASSGINIWLDNQLNNTVNTTDDTFTNRTKKIFEDFKAQALDKYGLSTISTGNATLPYNFYWRMAWWQRTLCKNNTNALTDNYTVRNKADTGDLGTYSKVSLNELSTDNMVRHRVAQALSEILVVSDKSILELDAIGMASFYDILYKNAFGNYSTLLKEVSLHPMMGVFLTYMNNKKTNGVQHPDENYAREIMQLFTIGLNELETTGIEKIDASGNFIPTYNNNDIKNLAKVFTGIKASEFRYEYNGTVTQGSQINLDTVVNKSHITIPFVNMEAPMIGQASQHDSTQKKLFDGKSYSITIPSGGSVENDITYAVNKLVAHPNTSIFIAKKLIQQLTSSNPSSSYIQNVASKFGTNGDLKAVIKEILTNNEAKNSTSKKLKSPQFRITQLLKSFNVHNSSGKLWFRGDMVDKMLNQHILSSPTVFNFYMPNYSPHGEIENNKKVAPEYQLHNSATSIAFTNLMYYLLFAGNGYLDVTVPTTIHESEHFRTTDVTKTVDKLKFNFSSEKALLTGITMSDDNGIDAVIERISLILIGNHNCDIKDEIKDTLMNKVGYLNKDWVIQTVIFLITSTPAFAIQMKR